MWFTSLGFRVVGVLGGGLGWLYCSFPGIGGFLGLVRYRFWVLGLVVWWVAVFGRFSMAC